MPFIRQPEYKKENKMFTTDKIIEFINRENKEILPMIRFDYYTKFDIDDNKKIVIVNEGYVEEVYNIHKKFIKEGNTYILEERLLNFNDVEEVILNLKGIIEEELIEDLVNKYKDIFKNYERKYESVLIDIRNVKNTLKNLCDTREQYRVFIANEEDIEKMESKIKREIELIRTQKNYESISLEGNTLDILVNDIIIYEEVSERYYYVGEVEILINLESCEIKYMPTSKTNTRRGYWGAKQVHPHVDCKGVPCLGNADAMIAEYITDREYYAAYLTAVNFLKSVDVYDCAGYAVSFWDECNEYGSIITEGHAPDYEEYGFESDEYGNYTEGYICDGCEEYFSNELDEYETPEGTLHLCDDCLEHYAYCEDTSRYVPKIDAYYINDEWFENKPDTFFCEDCNKEFLVDDAHVLNTPEGEITVCEDCAGHYVYCEDTERSVHESYAYYDGDTWYENDPEEIDF